MTTDVVENKSFQERMFDRIRDQMGDLMTQDELKKIVETAIDKAFFEPVITKDGYGHVRDTQPPFFVSLIKKEVQDQVTGCIKAWLKENPEKVDQVINDAIGKGMLGIITNYIENQARQPLYNFANELRNKGLLV